jgi:aldehyde:ferredoxin oxidoreductase
MGADCGIDDLVWVTRANYLCNDLGLDAMSAGVTPAPWKCSRMGCISHKIAWFMGLPCAIWSEIWDIERVLVMSWLTGRTGLHAQKNGHPEFSMTVKKMEPAAYDQRGLQGMGLSYATGV